MPGRDARDPRTRDFRGLGVGQENPVGALGRLLFALPLRPNRRAPHGPGRHGPPVRKPFRAWPPIRSSSLDKKASAGVYLLLNMWHAWKLNSLPHFFKEYSHATFNAKISEYFVDLLAHDRSPCARDPGPRQPLGQGLRSCGRTLGPGHLDHGPGRVPGERLRGPRPAGLQEQNLCL